MHQHVEQLRLVLAAARFNGQLLARDRGVQADGDTALAEALLEGAREIADSAAEMPGTEGLLDVGDRGENRGGLPRVGARVGRIAIEQLTLTRILQVLAPELAQGRERRNGAHVTGIARQGHQRAPVGKR